MQAKKGEFFSIFLAPLSYQLSALLLSAACIMVTLFLSQSFYTNNRNETLDYFHEKASIFKIQLEETINHNAKLLNQMASSATSNEQWQQNANYLATTNPTFQSIQWLDPDFQVRWVEPIRGNRTAMSLNMSIEKNRKRALMAAKNLKQTQITHVVQLIQGGNGFLIYVPVFKEKTLQGFLLGVFRLNDLLLPFLTQQGIHQYHYTLSEQRRTFFKSPEHSKKHYNDWHQNITIQLKNIEWKLTFWPKNPAINQLSTLLPNMILATGLFISVLLFFIIWGLGIVRNKTKPLTEESLTPLVQARNKKLLSLG